MSDSNLVYALLRTVTTTGSLGIGTVSNEGKVRFIVENAGLSNLVRVRARLNGQQTWTNLADLTGNANQVVDVFTWDQIEVLVLVYSSLNSGITVTASSFDGSVISVSTPDGDVDNINTVTFTSSDDSVIISADSETGVIDFIAVGGGGGGDTSNHSESFNATTDWSGPIADLYSFEVPYASHEKTNPVVQVFEENGADFDLVTTEVLIDGSHNVTILVSSSPDLRFAGKITIS